MALLKVYCQGKWELMYPETEDRQVEAPALNWGLGRSTRHSVKAEKLHIVAENALLPSSRLIPSSPV